MSRTAPGTKVLALRRRPGGDGENVKLHDQMTMMTMLTMTIVTMMMVMVTTMIITMTMM
jgi:hypothetical protein